MKTLGFQAHLADLMLRGEKTTTWRLFDDKDISTGDEISCINSATKLEFGTAKVIWVSAKTLGTLSDEDWQGHERFSSNEEMYATYKKYYPDKKVDGGTIVKVISLEFHAKGST